MKNHQKTLIFCFGLLAFFFLIKCSETSPTSPTLKVEEVATSDDYLPFPQGFDYPQDRNTINNWIDAGDQSAIREHAWSLFAGLNQKTEGWKRIWQTWNSIGVVFPKKDSIVENPILDTIPPGTKLLSPLFNPKSNCYTNGNLFFYTSMLFIGSTYYDKDATNWIGEKALHKKATLEKFYNTGRKNIPTAPSTAIVMKNIYWPVSGRADEYTPLPVWDGVGDRNPLVYNGFETWERAVAVTSNPNPPEIIDVSYLYNYVNREDYYYKYENIKPVGLDQFYHVKLDKKVISEFSAVDSCILNNSFTYVFNRDFEEGDYLVCIAQHLITKEISNWAMQTIWWHDQPDKGIYAKDRPTNIPSGLWEHYLLSTAYFMVDPSIPDEVPHIGFNPYIELVLPEQNRTRSNCQNCHIRAGYPEKDGAFFIADPVGGPIKFPDQPTAFYHSLREGFIGKQDSIFDNIMRSDFNWAIPDRAN